MSLYVLLKRIYFLFNQMIFSSLILVLLFCHVNLLFVQHLVHHRHVRLLYLLLLYVTVKTSVIVLYVVFLSVRVAAILIELVNLHTLLLVLLIVLQILVNSFKFTPTNLHSFDSSASTFDVVSHLNIHRKRKLRKVVVSLSFVNSGNSYDIARKRIVMRDRLNVFTKPGNYYIPSIFFLPVLFWEFSMLGIFINNNSFLESNSKFIFKDRFYT